MAPDIQFSFVIPTYNRAALVSESVRSAIDWLGDQRDGEVVLVDDCSVDNTIAAMERKFGHEIEKGLLRIVALPQNVGVIGAKNVGARAARGHWLIFLDSDDQMIAESAGLMRQAFFEFRRSPVLFFRCVNLFTQELLGAPQESPTVYALRDHLKAICCNAHYGECLPAVRRDAFDLFPYDENFNGLEGITYARMLRQIGSFVVLPIKARQYRVEGDDRLSSPAGIRRRSWAMARGHWLVLREFGSQLTVLQWAREAAKVAFYGLQAVTTFIM